MNPQQPYQPPPSPGSEYDFFMSPQKPQRRNPLSGLGGGNSMAMRVGIIAGLAFVVMMLLYFALSLLGGSSNKPNLITVAQDQNELIRVTGLATTDGATQSAQSTQNFAQSAGLSLASEQQDLLNFMAANGGKPSPKLLAQTQDSNTDTELNNAIASSNFDTTFVSIMQTQLKSYQAALQIAFKGAHNTTEKQLLSDDYKSAGLLFEELDSSTQ
jgi:hypothetical protein